MKIIDCQQGSTKWFVARLAKITASEIDELVSPTGQIRVGERPTTYLHKKLAEKVLNWSPDQLNTFPMEQGKIIENMAIPWYEFESGIKVSRPGFCVTDDDRCGCSPDFLAPDGSGGEVKSPQPPNHIKYVLDNKVPDAYVSQVQFSLWVTKGPYWKFISYTISPDLPQLVVHAEPMQHFQDAISEAVFKFSERFDAALKRLQDMNPNKGRTS